MTRSVLADPTWLAVDAGQTATKLRVMVTGEKPREFAYPGIRTHEPLLPQLARVTESVCSNVVPTIDAVALGVSGLTKTDADPEGLLSLVSSVGTRRVLLAHDSVTSYLGSLGERPGAVIAAGTGVVTLGVGAKSVARVDGWGNIMGDAGSGYWIGQQALERAMRAHDGREAPTALVDAVRERWTDIEDAYVSLQSDPDRVRIVASFAETVTRLAPTDTAAAQISLRAARELARSVLTALQRVEQPSRGSGEVVTAIGGVFRSTLIRSRFEELVLESRPEVRIVPPRGTGLDGAAELLTLAATHPLQAHVLSTVH